MFLIKLVLLGAVITLYSLAAKVILKHLHIPVSVRTILIFVVSGGIAGVASLLVYGTFLAETEGHIGEDLEILSMFLVPLFVAIPVSIGVVKITYPH